MKFNRSAMCIATIALVYACHAGAQGSAPQVTASGAAAASSSMQSKPSKSSKAADRALTRRVLTALGRAKDLRASGITVRARDGAILLEGWVPEVAQIALATRVAQGVSGVKSVQNLLTLSTF
jgi:hyperosmotically inducible periplasmic protein